MSLLSPLSFLFFLNVSMIIMASSPQFTIPLTNADNAAYFANIAFGIPPQNFTVLIDTASGNFWLPSVFCTTSTACIGYNQYNPATSISSQTCGQQFNITVFTNGQSSNVIGQIYKDIFAMGNFINAFQQFGGAVAIDGTSLIGRPYDGIMGMTYSSLSCTGKSVPCSAVFYNLLDQPSFGLWLNGPVGDFGGELDFGGYNSARFIPPLTQFPIVGGTDYWKIALDTVAAGTTMITTPSALAVFDTSTQYIYGPITNTTILNNRLGGTLQSDGRYLLNCATIPTLPNVTLVFSGLSFVLTPAQYVVVDPSTAQCFSPFVGRDYQNVCGPSIWVVGLSFLRTYYTTYDLLAGQVGIALAAAPLS